MNLRILYFASLRDVSGQSETQLDVEVGKSITDLWKRLSAGFDSQPSKVLCAVNQEFVDTEYLLKEGDVEVAFFPPVTGG